MKKFTTLFVFAVFALTACKKEYTCSCVSTISSGGSNETAKNDTKVYSEKMTEKQAKAACNHEEQAIESSYRNLFASIGITTVNISSNCSLK